MASRISMLEGIRANLAKSAPFEHLYQHLQQSAYVSRVAPPAPLQNELADRFAAELTTVGGEVHRVGTDEEAEESIRSIFAELNAIGVAISDPQLLNGATFPDVEFIAAPSREQLFSVDAGVTRAQLAIAETGTLVLRSAGERNRLASLVPPIHICVLKASDIRLSMHDVLEEISGEIEPAVTFITGPSRTSDIELTLAIGVHGPKRLIVVLIDSI